MSNPFSSIKEKITRYIQLRYEDFRLEIIERIVNVMGYFAFIIIAIFLAFIGIIFIGFGLAEWLSTMFDSRTAGYFATAAFFIIIAIIAIFSGKAMTRFFAGKMALLLTMKKQKRNSHDEDDDEERN